MVYLRIPQQDFLILFASNVRSACVLRAVYGLELPKACEEGKNGREIKVMKDSREGVKNFFIREKGV